MSITTNLFMHDTSIISIKKCKAGEDGEGHAHDWYYERTEDPHVYDRGDRNRKYLESIMREGGEEYKRIYFNYES